MVVQGGAQAVIVRPRWTDEQFDRWIFPQHDCAGARQIERIDQAYRLTEAQKNKLRLAGRGDIKRFFDRYDSAKQKFQLIGQDVQKLEAILQDTQPLRAAAHDLFREDSLLFKALPNTLTAEQLARYEAVARERRAFSQVRLLQGHQGEGWHRWVTRLAVSADGRQLVTVSGDAVRLWDLQSAKPFASSGSIQAIIGPSPSPVMDGGLPRVPMTTPPGCGTLPLARKCSGLRVIRMRFGAWQGGFKWKLVQKSPSRISSLQDPLQQRGRS